MAASEKNRSEGQSKGANKKKIGKGKKNEDTAKSTDPNSMAKQIRGKQPRGKQPRGLNNLGNTCYFNSVMQPLCQTHSLRSQCDSRNGKITRSFISMVDEMANGETLPFSAAELRNDFVKTVTRFDNRRQHDSHECLRHFLDEVRKEEREIKGSSASSNQLTVVDKVFGGHLVTVYICEECKKHYHLFEPCLDISLPVFFEKGEERKIADQPQYSGANESRQMPNQSEVGLQVDAIKRKTNIFEPLLTSIKKIKNRQDTQLTTRDSNSATANSGPPEANKYQRNKEQTTDMNVRIYRHTISKLMTPLSSESNITPNLPKTQTDTTTKRHSQRKSHVFEKKQINLYDCLAHFSRIEEIKKEYLCEDCLREAMAKGEADEDNLKLTSATKQTLIFNPPAILTIHFKRFELLPGRSRKRSDMVTYPEYLDIAPYCSSQCLRNDPSSNNIWYSLYAVVVHSGSLDSGHYVAYVKVREGEKNINELSKFHQHEYFNYNITCDELIRMIDKRQLNLVQPETNSSMKIKKTKNNSIAPERVESKWYLLNDSSVREVSLTKVLEQEAYLLFYERVCDAEDITPMTESNVFTIVSTATENSHTVQNETAL